MYKAVQPFFDCCFVLFCHLGECFFLYPRPYPESEPHRKPAGAKGRNTAVGCNHTTNSRLQRGKHCSLMKSHNQLQAVKKNSGTLLWNAITHLATGFKGRKPTLGVNHTTTSRPLRPRGHLKQSSKRRRPLQTSFRTPLADKTRRKP